MLSRMVAIKFTPLILQMRNQEAQSGTEWPKIRQPAEDKGGLGSPDLAFHSLHHDKDGDILKVPVKYLLTFIVRKSHAEWLTPSAFLA